MICKLGVMRLKLQPLLGEVSYPRTGWPLYLRYTINSICCWGCRACCGIDPGRVGGLWLRSGELMGSAGDARRSAVVKEDCNIIAGSLRRGVCIHGQPNHSSLFRDA